MKRMIIQCTLFICGVLVSCKKEEIKPVSDNKATYKVSFNCDSSLIIFLSGDPTIYYKDDKVNHIQLPDSFYAEKGDTITVEIPSGVSNPILIRTRMYINDSLVVDTTDDGFYYIIN